MNALDQIRLNFDPAMLTLLNIILGVVMFGIALDIRRSDFKAIFDFPKAMLIGLLGQFVLLPGLSFVLVTVLSPAPSVALGMMLVAACPGGNISNFLVYLARGNTALSVCMTAVSTLFALVMTPLNFSLWGSLYPPTRTLLKEISLNPLDLMSAIFLLLGLPLALGLFLSQNFPGIALRLKNPMKIFSMIFFGGFIVAALAANWQNFLNYVGLVAGAVFLQNAIGLMSGYLAARFASLPERDRRAVAIEVGIQNSGLGLILIFNFFDGLGGMALIAAWWGIWHIISGYTLALFWSRRTRKAELRSRV